MTDDILEDKYERFFRYFDIDIKAIEEAATGGSLTDYYTKTQADVITNALDSRVTALEEGGGGGGDLTNYYTKGETNALLANKQSTNAELTAIIGLSPANNDIIQRKASAWTTRTPGQLKLDLSLDNVNNTSDANKPIGTATQTALDAKQDLDSDLTAIAALSPTNNDVLQRIAGVWTNRTPAQVKTSLSLVPSDVALGNVNNTSDANKPVSTATQTALDGKQTLDADLTTIAGLTVVNDSIMQGKSGSWAVRTPAQFKTDLSLVKADVGLGSVDNTSDTSKPVSTATQTALDLKAALTVTNALDSRITTLETPSIGTLTHGSTVTPDANGTRNLKWTMTGDATLAVPTGGVEGERMFISILASGADRTLTINASYKLTVGTSASVVIPNTKSQYIGLRYNGTSWAVIASTQEQ